MALSYSVAPTRAAPSQSLIKFPTLLRANKFYTNQINVFANRGSHYKVASPSSLTVISKKVEPMEVVLVDGFEPASINPPKDLKRSDFPSCFKFGASTSAIQEDVKLLKAMGMNSYRFSIAWPRILPKGSEEDGPINQEGIDFYNKFIDALIAEGIEPVITLFHFDLPVALQNKYHGFMNSQIVEDFKKYADICFANFGDRVKYWSTINEPYVFGSFGYKMGLPNDGKSDLGPFVATHNIILAHAAAAQIYHDKYQKNQKGKIGISLPCKWYEPHSTNPTDVVAAHRQLDFMLGWYMDPFVYGDYPESMKDSIRELPKFTKEQRKMVKKSCDFIGVNYYTARFAKQTTKVDPQKGKIIVEYIEELVNANGTIIGEQAEGQADIYVNPAGLRNLLLYITEKYDKPELFVTENGIPAKPIITGSVMDLIKEGKVKELKAAFFDDKRISHVEDHLTAIREARRQGANVEGYFVWSLMDNMEVGAGYDVRFGLNYTDYYDNLKRYPKKSAKWFTNFLATPPKKN
uniref:Beta-glucosidase n=1 Tax=Chenopodium quinoa TaxID=63459 RepID=A0A803MAT8_CHEQI